MPFFLIPCACGHTTRVLAHTRPLNRHMGQCAACIEADWHAREAKRNREGRLRRWREPVLTPR